MEGRLLFSDLRAAFENQTAIVDKLLWFVDFVVSALSELLCFGILNFPIFPSRSLSDILLFLGMP